MLCKEKKRIEFSLEWNYALLFSVCVAWFEQVSQHICGSSHPYMTSFLSLDEWNFPGQLSRSWKLGNSQLPIPENKKAKLVP